MYTESSVFRSALRREGAHLAGLALYIVDFGRPRQGYCRTGNQGTTER